MDLSRDKNEENEGLPTERDGGVPGYGPRDIVVKKGNVRDFITLCVDIASCVTVEEQKFLYMKALKDGIFEGKYSVYSIEDVEDQDPISNLALSLAQNSKYGICELVKNIAKFQTEKKAFWIIKNNGIVGVRTDKPMFTERLGYSMKLCEIGEDWKNLNDIDYDLIKGEIRRSGITDAFMVALNEYMKKRGINWSELPLRFCDYCGMPFFGNRYDQRFCKTLHGQRWHAEKSRAVKREKALDSDK